MQYPGLVDLWLEDSRAWQTAGLPVPRELSFGWLAGWEVVFYDIGMPNGTSSHVRAHWVQPGTWIDLHLSVAGSDSSDELRSELKRILEKIEVLEGKQENDSGATRAPPKPEKK
jgi:hypothetical protein